MNITKRTFNPLLGRIFRFVQSENSSLKYEGNWGPAVAQTVSASSWTVEEGDATLSSEALVSQTTSVIITGTPGENIIVNKVTLADGQIEERILKLKITDNDLPDYDTDYGFRG